MKMNWGFVPVVVASATLGFWASTGVTAAGDNVDAQVYKLPDVQFNEKINSWADGTIMSVDAKEGKFSVRGAKRPYATAYASMLKEIHAKTDKLTGNDRLGIAAEIRNAHRSKLAAAQSQPSDRDSDFTFNLPAREGRITSFEESQYYGRDLQEIESAPNSAQVSPKEAARMLALKDLRIGDRVIVGYESGLLANYAYAVIRARHGDVPYPTAEEQGILLETAAADNTKINQRDSDPIEVTAGDQKQDNSDIEITRDIRRAIVKDDTLSTYAHNIKIITQDGAVTLKGPVRSVVEKSEIERKATAVAGEGHVTNQVQVVP